MARPIKLKYGDVNGNIKKLEASKRLTQEVQNKYFEAFSDKARYLNGVYFIGELKNTRIASSDTRELFLRYVAQKEGIDVEITYDD